MTFHSILKALLRLTTYTNFSTVFDVSAVYGLISGRRVDVLQYLGATPPPSVPTAAAAAEMG